MGFPSRDRLSEETLGSSDMWNGHHKGFYAIGMKEGGVTLLELLVTVVVTAILMVVAVPTLTSLIQNNRLTSTTNELVTAFNVARSEAVKRSAVVSVVSKNDAAHWAEGWSVRADVNQDGDLDDEVDIVREFKAVDGDAQLVGNTDQVDFLATGFSSGIVQGAAVLPAIFDLTLPGATRWRRIQVNLTGGVVVERHDN